MRRKLTPTVLTAAAVAGVVTFSLVASAPVGNAAARPSSAYAVSAEGQVPIPKTPYAESLDGKRQTTSALELPQNPLLSVRAGTATRATTRRRWNCSTSSSGRTSSAR